MTLALLERRFEKRVKIEQAELMQLFNYCKQLNFFQKRLFKKSCGHSKSRFLGKGMDFAESRKYHSGDDIRSIDWKVTARSHKAHTKLFHVESTKEINVCLDLSNSMNFATKGSFKSVQAALTAALIGSCAAQQNFTTNLYLFNDHFSDCFKHQSGHKNLFRFFQKVASSNFLAQKPDFDPDCDKEIMPNLIAKIFTTSHTGSSLFLISDFRKLSAESLQQLTLLSRKCRLNLIYIYDDFEAKLPKAAPFWVSLFGQKSQLIDPKSSAAKLDYENRFKLRFERVKKLSELQNISFLAISTSDNCLEGLKKHLL